MQYEGNRNFLIMLNKINSKISIIILKKLKFLIGKKE